MVHLLLPQQSRCSLEMYNYDLTSHFYRQHLLLFWIFDLYLPLWLSSLDSSWWKFDSVEVTVYWRRFITVKAASPGKHKHQSSHRAATHGHQSVRPALRETPSQPNTAAHAAHNPTHYTALSLKGQRSRAAHLMISHNSTSTSRALVYKQGANRCSFVLILDEIQAEI